MSSHYIYLACSVEGCDTSESIYTGSVASYLFDSSAWEGETISIPCKNHTPETETP